MTATLKIHPFAETYPPMTEAELDAPAADIAERGLQRPIVLYQDAILDGRNRYLACEKAGVEPSFVAYEGDDPLGQVNSLNLNRDLTSAQRAIIAAKQCMMNGDTKDKGKGRRGGDDKVKTKPHSAERLAKQFRASKPTILQARDLLADAPDLAAQVESCTLSLAAAHDQLQTRRKEATRKARDAEKAAEYKDAISSGDMTIEEAIQKAIEQEREASEITASMSDTRRRWLKGFAEHLAWFETFLGACEEERMAWYTLPNSPGLFEHGVTAERVAAVIAYLELARDITFKTRMSRPG